MECFKVYYVVVFGLLTFVEVAFAEVDFSITFKGREPNYVLAGSNLTLNWTYDAKGNDVIDVRFGIGRFSNQSLHMMARYYVPSRRLSFQNPGNYCDSIEWLGETSKSVATFKMSNVTELAYGKTFAISFYLGPGKGYQRNILVPLLMAVLPKVKLRISNNNVTAGDLVTIQCIIVSGRPEPTISWYRNGKLVEDKTGRYFLNDQEIEENDAGSYKCVGKSDVGSDESSEITVAVHQKRGGEDRGNRPNTGKRSSGLGVGSIVGIVIGTLAFVVIVVVLVYLIKRKQRTPTKRSGTKVDGDESKNAMVPELPKKDQVWL